MIQDFLTNLHTTLKPLDFKKKRNTFSTAYNGPFTSKRKHLNIRLHSTNENRTYTYETEPVIT